MQDFSNADNLTQEDLRSRIGDLSKSSEFWRKAKLVAVTIAGIIALLSIIFEIMQDADTTRLSATQERLSDVLQLESKTAIAGATERASAADERAAEAIKQAAEATLLAKTYESDIATANTKAAEAQLETERMRERFADRAIDETAYLELIKAAQNFEGQEFGITTYLDLREPRALANRILNALHRAGWVAIKPKNGRFLMPGASGVDVYSQPDADESTIEAADALVEILNGLGVEAEHKRANGNKPPSNRIQINVGVKP